MAVTNYYSFGGEILGEETGGVRMDYLTDALGSVTATVTGAGTVENTYRYKPYGEQLAKTGSGSDPKFLWNGKWGYRRATNNSSKYYIRLRYLDATQGIWITIDPVGYIAGINRFSYVSGNPVTVVDPSGLISCKKCQEICKSGNSPSLAELCIKCWKNCDMDCKEWENRLDPPLCSSELGLFPVYVSCYSPNGRGGECAVYCPREDCYCMNLPHPDPGNDYPGSDRPLCDTKFKPILEIPGFGKCKVSNAGCGQQRRNVPQPNNWIDFPGCSGLKCWKCLKLPPACDPKTKHPSPDCKRSIGGNNPRPLPPGGLPPSW